jgi:hypothetical protein
MDQTKFDFNREALSRHSLPESVRGAPYKQPISVVDPRLPDTRRAEDD